MKWYSPPRYQTDWSSYYDQYNMWVITPRIYMKWYSPPRYQTDWSSYYGQYNMGVITIWELLHQVYTKWDSPLRYQTDWSSYYDQYNMGVITPSLYEVRFTSSLSNRLIILLWSIQYGSYYTKSIRSEIHLLVIKQTDHPTMINTTWELLHKSIWYSPPRYQTDWSSYYDQYNMGVITQVYMILTSSLSNRLIILLWSIQHGSYYTSLYDTHLLVIKQTDHPTMINMGVITPCLYDTHLLVIKQTDHPTMINMGVITPCLYDTHLLVIKQTDHPDVGVLGEAVVATRLNQSLTWCVRVQQVVESWREHKLINGTGNHLKYKSYCN